MLCLPNGSDTIIHQDPLPEGNDFCQKITYRVSGVKAEDLIASFRNSTFARLATGVGINHLSAGKFSKLAVPVPPEAEQRRIVAEIEKHFTRLDVAVEALKRVHANLRRYRAAVLKAACEGRLVPQEPGDEPASALLERIRAKGRIDRCEPRC